ncbi:cation:proton antiporter [uncultured Pseudodesulfovibrio sp.]|uniref:cation:proton antiporter n=1 Tax=uncultured Pseudodesulfovibrio sp. TaxID=2035858 RepID=UPI0029C820EF|nr:cation:proton antiporter [uncultured Pseudodesulfovibrio sp.]
MFSPASMLITLGLLFLAGLATDFIGRHTFLPRVSALILLGFLAGPSGFDILPDITSVWFPYVTDMILVMVGFLLGSSLTFTELRESGKSVFLISISVVVVTTLLVGAGLWMIGVPLPLSLLCGGIASSTDPTATMDVVHEMNIRNLPSRILLRIVAIDDAWGLIIFSILLVFVQSSVGGGGAGIVLTALWDIGGALFVGVALGLPMSFLTGRIRPGEPTLTEAVGMVLLCGGVALWLNVSHLLASMTMGIVVANLARHHTRPFRAIERIEWPFVVLFFIFAGASIHMEHLFDAGFVILAYMALRILGRFFGAKIGGRMAGAGIRMENWMGLALMPQAGVSLGMALVASHRFAGLDSIVTIVVSATVFFEIVGPVCVRFALRRMSS